jgi:hypothetical protein
MCCGCYEEKNCLTHYNALKDINTLAGLYTPNKIFQVQDQVYLCHKCQIDYQKRFNALLKYANDFSDKRVVMQILQINTKTNRLYQKTIMNNDSLKDNWNFLEECDKASNHVHFAVENKNTILHLCIHDCVAFFKGQSTKVMLQTFNVSPNRKWFCSRSSSIIFPDKNRPPEIKGQICNINITRTIFDKFLRSDVKWRSKCNVVNTTVIPQNRITISTMNLSDCPTHNDCFLYDGSNLVHQVMRSRGLDLRVHSRNTPQIVSTTELKVAKLEDCIQKIDDENRAQKNKVKRNRKKMKKQNAEKSCILDDKLIQDLEPGNEKSQHKAIQIDDLNQQVPQQKLDNKEVMKVVVVVSTLKNVHCYAEGCVNVNCTIH